MKRSTLVLFVVAGALLLFIFVFERKQRSTKEEQDNRDNIFASIPKDAVSIKREGFEDLLLEKVKEDWFLKKPVEDRADKSSVEGFLLTLEDAGASRMIKEKVDPEKLGLLKPSMKLTISSGDKEAVLETGIEPPLEKGAYFRAGDRVGVMGQFVLDTVRRSVNDFRSKELCAPLKPEDIRSMTYKKGGADVLVLENPKGRWLVKKPYEDLADGRKAYLLVEDVLLWPVMGFGEGAAEETGLSLPSETFEMTTFDNRRVTVSLGSVKDEKTKFYYASVSTREGVFIVSKNSVRDLEADPEQFRSLVVFPADMNSFETMTLEKGSQLFLRNDKEKGWIPEKAKIDENQVKTFIYAIASLSGEKRISPAEKGILSFTIDLKDKERVAAVNFYETGEGLTAEIGERKLFVSLSKEDGERMKSAIGALFTQGK